MRREEKEEEGEKRDYEIWNKKEKRVKWKGEKKGGKVEQRRRERKKNEKGNENISREI